MFWAFTVQIRKVVLLLRYWIDFNKFVDLFMICGAQIKFLVWLFIFQFLTNRWFYSNWLYLVSCICCWNHMDLACSSRIFKIFKTSNRGECFQWSFGWIEKINLFCFCFVDNISISGRIWTLTVLFWC